MYHQHLIMNSSQKCECVVHQKRRGWLSWLSMSLSRLDHPLNVRAMRAPDGHTLMSRLCVTRLRWVNPQFDIPLVPSPAESVTLTLNGSRPTGYHICMLTLSDLPKVSFYIQHQHERCVVGVCWHIGGNADGMAPLFIGRRICRKWTHSYR